jgi:hypothetical protein
VVRHAPHDQFAAGRACRYRCAMPSIHVSEAGERRLARSLGLWADRWVRR